mmetsp:Transcript_7507/g.11227  ORF Transcript_7507/g.11227 Transcript_7507/m.11227 type:complete len:209 (-) Transcript_7507:62-688(-)|eukprot:CAMPEP_0171455258 /NCGR_PEP_ID=MMETSP0945-20130129/2228_1 /TAXON_ID=109269 /ORGANISM="Vaucheria litorea, Strain CCMP2940" /LENGTH=208 /DNA_ID=CAMNT_0011980469 /DNA_START=57 /DNA_END=683 /DNA_ORIENTATION=+
MVFSSLLSLTIFIHLSQAFLSTNFKANPSHKILRSNKPIVFTHSKVVPLLKHSHFTTKLHANALPLERVTKIGKSKIVSKLRTKIISLFKAIFLGYDKEEELEQQKYATILKEHANRLASLKDTSESITDQAEEDEFHSSEEDLMSSLKQKMLELEDKKVDIDQEENYCADLSLLKEEENFSDADLNDAPKLANKEDAERMKKLFEAL